MKNLIKGLGLTLIFALIISSTIAQKSNGKKVLVTIGNETVTTDEFMQVYEKNNMQPDLYDEAAVKEYLDLYINFKLMRGFG